MVYKSGKNFINKTQLGLRSISAHFAPDQIKNQISSKAAIAASFVIAALVVWAWQASSSNPGRASISQSSTVSNGSSINSDVSTQPGTSADGSGGSASVSIQKDGDSPASVTVNGQPVDVPQNGSVHKVVNGSSNNTNLDINVENNSSSPSDSNSQNVSVFSNSTTQINSYSYSGGTNIQN